MGPIEVLARHLYHAPPSSIAHGTMRITQSAGFTRAKPGKSLILSPWLVIESFLKMMKMSAGSNASKASSAHVADEATRCFELKAKGRPHDRAYQHRLAHRRLLVRASPGLLQSPHTRA
jgi:hypothetical protein